MNYTTEIEPRVSVILPVYNGEATILRTLESVLAQTWSDLELIVIDDGSSDRTIELLEAFEPHATARWGRDRFQVVSRLNGGVSAARNAGARRARGTYLSFIDADDLWTVDKLADQVAALEAGCLAGFTPPETDRKQPAVAYSWVDAIDDSETWLRRGGHATKTGNLYESLLLIDLVECGSNVLVSRQAFWAVGGFSEGLKTAEDWDLWLRLARLYGFVNVPKVQVLYRQRSRSLSSDIWQMERDSFFILRREAGLVPLHSLVPLARRKRRSLLAASRSNRYKILAFDAIEAATIEPYPAQPTQPPQTPQTRGLSPLPETLAKARLDRPRARTALRYLLAIAVLDAWRACLCSNVWPHRDRWLRLLIKTVAIAYAPAPVWFKLRDRLGSLRDPEVVLLWTIQTEP